MHGFNILHAIVVLLFVSDIGFVILLFSSKSLNRINKKKYLENKRKLIDLVAETDGSPDFSRLKIRPKELFKIYKEISVSINFTVMVSESFLNYFINSGIVEKNCRSVKSRNRFKRSEAILNLAFLPCDKSRRALENALVSEKYYFVKILIVHSLIETEDFISIPYILQTLIGSPQWYKEKIYSIMGQFGEKLHDFLINLTSIDSKELKMVIISFANFYISPDIKSLLLEFLESEDPELASAASEPCRKFYPEILRSDRFIKSPLLSIRKNAVEATAELPSKESLSILIEAMHDHYIYNDCVSAVYRLVSDNNDLFSEVITLFKTEKDPVIKMGLAEVLSNRIDYLFTRLRSDSSDELKNIIKNIILSGNLRNTIAFLNENRDEKLEVKIFELIEDILAERIDISSELRLYLDERILTKLNMTKLEPQKGGTEKGGSEDRPSADISCHGPVFISRCLFH